MPIKKSLQNSILLMAVIPVILMAVFAYIAATTKYAEINTENIKNIAQDYSYAFSNQLKSQIIETTSLANTNELRNYLLEKVNTPDTLLKTTSANYNSVKDSIEQISADFNNTVSYYIYDVDGYLVLSSSPASSADWTEIMENPIESYTTTCVLPHSEFTQNTLDIVSPIMVNDSIIGLIRTNITIDYFGTYLSTSDNQENFIIDADGRPMFGYTIESHNTKLLENLKQLSSIGNGNVSGNRILPGTFSDGMDYICGYSFISDYNWLYITIRDPSTYTNIVSNLPILLLVVLIIVTLLSSQLSRSLAVKYTQPIIELSEKMQNAADGQLDVQCNMERDDEFGTLSDNFNQMMDIISANYNEVLESRRALETSQRELQCSYEDIEKQAYTDALTGLYNRMAFFKYAQEILSDSRKGFKNHAVIFIDLDGFKSINDTLGHDYGDLLLQAVSSKLSSFINKDDILARNGGDEFVILRNQINSREELEEFLETLVSIASHPFVLEDETVHITLSAGAALFPQNGLSLNELMKNADIAMYASKNTGKNSYTFFSSSMEDEVNRRNDLIDILRDAIDNKDIYLLYQPQADVSTGEILGCEALMRLNSPIVGFVSPDEFIPVAEECGLIDQLGEWALIEACCFNQRLMEAGFKPIKISVNVSTAQLRNNRLINVIKSLPEKTSMPLKYLEIELTESVLMNNFDRNLALINQIRELDIQIALDDFGTGYSSFNYLTKIPINTLKIDKSFIAGISDNEKDSYIASTIINLAHHLGISVIAEGVETIEQLRILQHQTCDILQGYFFSRAISENEFIDLLKINS